MCVHKHMYSSRKVPRVRMKLIARLQQLIYISASKIWKKTHNRETYSNMLIYKS